MAFDTSNGILARVPGQYISAGHSGLPAPGEAQRGEPERRVIIQVPGLGLVRVTYLLHSHRHRKSRHWFWTAVHAEQTDEAAG